MGIEKEKRRLGKNKKKKIKVVSERFILPKNRDTELKRLKKELKHSLRKIYINNKINKMK